MRSTLVQPASLIAATGYDFIVAVEDDNGQCYAASDPVVAWAVVETEEENGYCSVEIAPFGLMDEEQGWIDDVRGLGNFLGLARRPVEMDRWHRKAREWASRRQRAAS